MKKALKIVGIVVLAYVGLVAVFESLIGVLQPNDGSALVLTTFEADGTAHDRVLARLESGGRVYVAANHWPRQWYERALENPEVRMSFDGKTADYRAVPVEAEEHARVEGDRPLGLGFRFLTGFPPRYFLRLDPR